MMPVSFRVKLVDAKQYQVVAEQFQGRAGVERVVDQRATLEPLFKVMDRGLMVCRRPSHCDGGGSVLADHHHH